ESPHHGRRRLPRVAPGRPLHRRGALGRRARQLHHRPPRQPGAPAAARGVRVRPARHLRLQLRRRAARRRAPLRLAREPGRLPRAPDRDAQGGLPRHAQRARDRAGEGRPLLPRLHVRGLRRPARAPAAGELLGERQPDRPAELLRRGQAVRGSADDGVPPGARPRHAHRAHLQHVRAAHAPERRAGGVELHRAGAARGADHHLRRGLADPQLHLRVGRGGRDLQAVHAGRCRAHEHRQPHRVHGAPARRDRRRAHRHELADRGPPPAGRRPQGAPARHHPGAHDARLGAAGPRARGDRPDDRVLPVGAAARRGGRGAV
ncbi:MAG: UDP-glucuronate decarboxylase, partial [uncultured Gemmatimonadaceae bacterium]